MTKKTPRGAAGFMWYRHNFVDASHRSEGLSLRANGALLALTNALGCVGPVSNTDTVLCKHAGVDRRSWGPIRAELQPFLCEVGDGKVSLTFLEEIRAEYISNCEAARKGGQETQKRARERREKQEQKQAQESTPTSTEGREPESTPPSTIQDRDTDGDKDKEPNRTDTPELDEATVDSVFEDKISGPPPELPPLEAYGDPDGDPDEPDPPPRKGNGSHTGDGSDWLGGILEALDAEDSGNVLTVLNPLLDGQPHPERHARLERIKSDTRHPLHLARGAFEFIEAGGFTKNNPFGYFIGILGKGALSWWIEYRAELERLEERQAAQ